MTIINGCKSPHRTDPGFEVNVTFALDVQLRQLMDWIEKRETAYSRRLLRKPTPETAGT